MKKVISLLFCFCLAVLMQAQSIQFHQGDKPNRKAYAPHMIHIAPADQEGLLLVVEPELKAISAGNSIGANSVKDIKVRLCDEEWKDTKSVEIENSKKGLILEAFRNGSLLHILLSREESGAFTVRHIALDANTLEIKSDKAIVTLTLERGESGECLTSISEDGNQIGLAYVLWGKKEPRYARAALFNRNMEQQWSQSLTYPNIHEILTTDEGSIATAALGYIKGNSESVFRFNLATATEAKELELSVEEDIERLALLNCKQGRILVTALEGKGGNGVNLLGFTTLGLRRHTGVRSYSIDLAGGNKYSSHLHEFTKEEICIFDNTAKPSLVANESTNFLMVRDHCSTKQGGAVLYQEAWEKEVRNTKNGMTNTTFYSNGMLLMQVDMEGNFKQINAIRQRNQNAKEPMVGSDLFVFNDKLYVVTNESKEASNEYTTSEPAKLSLSLSLTSATNGAVAVYYFTSDGVGAKQMVEKESKSLLFTPLYAVGGGKFYLLTGTLYPRITSITIP